MRRMLLIANPAASAFTASLHRDVVEILERGYRISAVWPDGPAQARSEAKAAAHDGFDAVCAMGGDGTVHEVVNGIVGSPTALGIVPAGTTNVVRRLVGLPRRPRDAAEALTRSTSSRPLPALSVSLTSGARTDSHVAAFAAGIGFDAEVIRDSERRPLGKIRFGTLHYARSALRIARRFRTRPPNIRVENGGDSRSAHAVGAVFQIHDNYTYMGRVPLTLGRGPKPLALAVGSVSPGRLTRLAARAAMRRDLGAASGNESWEGFDHITATAEPAAWVGADGETLGRTHRLDVARETRPLLVLSRQD